MRIHDSGQTDYAAAVVTTELAGALDDATYNADATADTGAVVLSGSTLVWTGPLAAGATATLTYSVTVTDPDPGDRVLVTTVSSAAPGSTCGTAASCFNSVTVFIPGLDVAMSADVGTATPGDRIVFTAVLRNTGQTPYIGTVATWDLGTVLDDATFDAVIHASRGVATYAAPQVRWTGSLDVGETVTITYAVTVTSPDPGDRTMAVRAVVDEPGSTCRPASADPLCSAEVEVRIPGLDIVISAGSSTTTPGSVVDYTVVVTNTGETPYTAAALAVDLNGVLPDSDFNDDAIVVGGGVLVYSAKVLSWSGALPVGGTARITYSVTVDDPDTGDKLLTSNVVSSSPGSTCPAPGTGPGCSVQVRVLVPALEITKTADRTTVVAGELVTYTVTLVNTGETDYVPAQFADSLAGVLDDATFDGQAAASQGTVDYTDGVLVWTGALEVGATATVTYTVSTDFPATGDGTLDNAVVSTVAGSSCSTADQAGCSTSVRVLTPQLTVTKTADRSRVVAGGTVAYTIVATNTGQSDYDMAELSDSLVGVLDDASYDGNAAATTGTLTDTGTTLSWTGPLTRGSSVTITYTVVVDTTDAGDDLLTNTVTSSSNGSTCDPLGPAPACTATTPVDEVTLVLSDLTSSFTLTGPPDSNPELQDAVTMTVTTNSPGGYFVIVQAATSFLTGADPLNHEVIPVGNLQVRGTGSNIYQPLSPDFARLVHSQDGPSSPTGDAVSNDYAVDVPFVNPDNYSVTLNYVVGSQ